MLNPMTMTWITYGVAALFALGGGVMNLFPPPAFVEGYRRWGYPSWWHYVTAALNFLGVTLLVIHQTRAAGALLLAAVTAAAILTVVRHREYGRAIAPALLLLIALIPLLPVRGGT